MTRRIIALNNTGIKSLECGRYNEAILCFRHAMDCLANAAPIAAFPSNEEVKMFQEVIVPPRCDLDFLDQSLSMAISPHNMFETYQSAFYLPKMALTTEDSPEISIVLFYNIGLAYHLLGLSGREVTDICFGESMRFYKAALMVFKSHGFSRLDSYSLILGLLCNLGYIFSHYCKVDDAKSCGSMMETILDSEGAMHVEDEEANFFCSASAWCSTLSCSLASAA